MKLTKLILFISAFFIVVASCNKEKRYSNKLIKGEKWEVKELSVDGNSLEVFGTWDVVSDGSIYDSVPRVNWSDNGQGTIFEWQFQEKGKKFQLNYVQLCEECEGDELSELDSLCYAITGKYDVEKHGKNKMEFVSNSTIGNSGKSVKIAIERK